MSTLKVAAIQHPSSTAANLTLAADGTVTGGLPAGGRNLLYNGAMQVAQRGTSTASITTSGYYTADRWVFNVSSLGTWTQSVENDAPTGSGLRKSLKMLCTTADASPAAGDYAIIQHRLEGQDVQRIAKGTASAQQLTLSFWVKSNVTGTYIASLSDVDNSRYVSASYTVSASATWEKKTITFPADTTGTLDNDNGASLQLSFGLGAGSDFTGGSLPTTWGTSTTGLYAGQTNLAAANNNYWQVTGVQLEVGPVASAFEFKSFGQELRECQRYYYGAAQTEVWGNVAFGIAASTTKVYATVIHPVSMRTTPASIDYANLEISDLVNTATTPTAVAITTNNSGRNRTLLNVDAASGLTQYRSYFIRAANNAAGYVALSAEL